jgi:hypothetical protein
VSWPWFVALALLAIPLHLDPLNRLPLLPSVLVLLFPFSIPILMMTRRSLSSPTAQDHFARS